MAIARLPRRVLGSLNRRPCALVSSRLRAIVKVLAPEPKSDPAESQNIVPARAGECRDGDDRIEHGTAEGAQQRGKLLLIENLSRVALAGNGRFRPGRRADDKQSLPHGRTETIPEHGMSVVHRPRR